MKRITNAIIYLMIFLLFFQYAPQVNAFENIDVLTESEEETYSFAEIPEDFTNLYEDEDLSEVLTVIPDGSKINIIEENEDISLISYIEEAEDQDIDGDGEGVEWIGYIQNYHLIKSAELETFLQHRTEKSFDLEEYYNQNRNASKVDEQVDEDSSDESEDVQSEDIKDTDDSITVNTPEDSDVESIPNDNAEKKQIQNNRLAESYSNEEEPDSDKDVENVIITQLRGLAVSNPTNVYSEASKSSVALKSYKQGQLLLFHSDGTSEWYTATVYINGKKQTGYIHNKDVDILIDGQRLEGFALKHPVSVYADTSRGSNILRNYGYGQKLIYRFYSTQWYEATVYINGKAQTGYIHVSDAGSPNLAASATGVALKATTNIYSNTSGSGILKSYKKGQILKYRVYDTNWYSATVYINGKAQTGYIRANDVDTAVTSKTNVKGVGIKSPTKVFSSATNDSSVLKSYQYGQILQYRTFTSNWYEATVYVNGKPQVGYIQGSDVGNMNTTLKGYALANQTNVYSDTSKSASILRSYRPGSQLQFRAYNSNWYIATAYINGKAQTGYISKSDVGEQLPIEKGYALINPTAVYKSTSKSSAKLKTYKQGQLLQYRVHNSSWYVATVYVNGKAQTGYIHVNDVGTASELAALRTIVNPRKVYSYNNMVSDIKKLQQAYPDIIKYKVVGKSEYGRDIYAVSLGKGKATTFINGSHHAREWLTTNLNMNMIEAYAKAYVNNSSIQGFPARSILNSATIWFIPMVNPDGVTLQQEGLKAFPKSMHASLIKMNLGSLNFKRWKANAKGVDLNRQYDAGWATIKNNPGKPNYQNYKGTAPATASEVKAVLKLVAEINPEMAVAYHSSGQILYWNYKQNTADYNRDHVYAKTIGRMTGYSLVYPGPNPSGGGFTDWFIQAKKRPGFTPEITPYVYETNPPLSEYNGVWRENQAVGLYVAQESAKLYNARNR